MSSISGWGIGGATDVRSGRGMASSDHSPEVRSGRRSRIPIASPFTHNAHTLPLSSFSDQHLELVRKSSQCPTSHSASLEPVVLVMRVTMSPVLVHSIGIDEHGLPGFYRVRHGMLLKYYPVTKSIREPAGYISPKSSFINGLLTQPTRMKITLSTISNNTYMLRG